jgi:hypothetical protein
VPAGLPPIADELPPGTLKQPCCCPVSVLDELPGN